MVLVNLGGEQKGPQAIGRALQELEAEQHGRRGGKSLITAQNTQVLGKFHYGMRAFTPKSRGQRTQTCKMCSG